MKIISKQTVVRTNQPLGWSARIAGATRVLGAILFLALLQKPVQAVQSVTLAWNANVDPTVAGCNLYYGVASGTYTNVVNVGNVTNATIPGLVEGTTYYFAATAYDILGLESVYSNEASYAVPAKIAGAELQIRATPARQVILNVTGQVGHTYNIQASPDLTTWTIIGTVTVPAGGSLNFTDTNAASFLKRFYRTQ